MPSERSVARHGQRGWCEIGRARGLQRIEDRLALVLVNWVTVLQELVLEAT
ncbi:MAG TPA: hypothetical protein VFQ61_38960 [Polyangiaceae bacterium]|nr:hypothetical protein [Polyangiaceae bacterium]